MLTTCLLKKKGKDVSIEEKEKRRGFSWGGEGRGKIALTPRSLLSEEKKGLLR